MPSEPVHLLGGHELRQPPADIGFVVGREDAVAALDLANVERAVDHVGNARTGRVEARIVHRTGGGELARPSLEEVREEHPALHRAHRSREIAVGRVLGHPVGAFASALAPRSLGLGQRGLVLDDGVVARVEDQPLEAGAHVEHPQTRDGIVARSGAKERDARAVGRDRERPRNAEREPARAADLPRVFLERIDHDRITSRDGPRGPGTT